MGTPPNPYDDRDSTFETFSGHVIADEVVVAVDQCARICSTYYLDAPVATIDRRPRRLRAKLANSPFLLISRQPLRRRYRKTATTCVEIVDVPGTAGLYRLQYLADGPHWEGTPPESNDPGDEVGHDAVGFGLGGGLLLDIGTRL